MNARGIGLALIAISALRAGAAEVIPPPPGSHFNDFASAVTPETAQRLDQELAQFERSTSNQILVAIYPKMQSDSSIEDYTVRVAQAWHAGVKGRDNGAVLFIFIQSHQMYLEVGYGLEGAIPDALAKRIIEDVIAPALHRGDFDGGVTAGVAAILAAARGEYKGTGQTVREQRGQRSLPPAGVAAIIIAFLILSYLRRQASVYRGGGRSGFGAGMLAGMFLGGGGRGFGGGGFGGGGGGFSGGGGGFGGGGAGGSW